MPLTDLKNSALDVWHDANSYVTNLVTPTLRLGVTGLARSGKTVFITALVRNLVEGGRLPFFEAAASGRILRAYLEPQPDDDVPRFAYEEHLALIGADPPDWPVSTRHISQLRVTVEYEPQNIVWRTVGLNRLHIDIVDYPGEWLIDLPLIEMNYKAWSFDALELARHPTRRVHAEPFLDFLDKLQQRLNGAGATAATSSGKGAPGPDTIRVSRAEDPEQIALEGARLFTTYLKNARADDHALSIAGPGRFLMPGDLEGSPLVTFFPLPESISSLEDAGFPAAAQSNRVPLPALLKQRYGSYKSVVVKPFFRNHFIRLDRQIVLVDALAALNAGPEALVDLQNALHKILSCFRPGAGNWLSTLLFRRIDRLLFAATKADHLHHTSHDKLEAVMRELTENALQRAQISGAQVDVMALAALRATKEVEIRQRGEVLGSIKGTPLPGERLGDQVFDGKTQAVIFPGDLPDDAVQAVKAGRETAGAQELDMRFIRFRPPALAQTDADGAPGALPHIRLDRALEFLFGDRLQ